MASTEGLEKLKAKMRQLRERHGREPRIIVVTGFTQRYALHVHEDLEAFHPVGQAKYLEQPARQLGPEMVKMVVQGVKAGITLGDALVPPMLRLQRGAQEITPVDTSALKASAFTCKEEELEQTSTAKFAESETIRLAEKKTP